MTEFRAFSAITEKLSVGSSISGTKAAEEEEDVVPSGRILVYKDAEGDIEDFIMKFKPSNIIQSDIEWLQVRNPNRKRPLRALNNIEILEKWTHLSLKHRYLSEAHILALAEISGYMSGKWTVLLLQDDVDVCWEKVVKALLAGQLGTSVQISTSVKCEGVRKHGYILHVHTANFMNKDDVTRVGRKIKNLLGIWGQKLCYRPDIISSLDIHSHNKWGIDTITYRI